jgi:hypothetical protein
MYDLKYVLRRFLRVSHKQLAGVIALFDRNTLAGLAPALAALILLPWLIAGIRSELREPLFSDQLLFMYTGWCLRHGMHLYRDFGMPDGPFTHLMYATVEALGGLSDRGFRRVDLTLHIACAATMGIVLAPAADPRRGARWLHRIAWASVVTTLWLSTYLYSGWEGTCQREGYYSLFGSAGLVLLYASGGYGSGGRAGSLVARPIAAFGVVAGAILVTLQVFGKPTGAMYAASGALGVLLPDEAATFDRKHRVRFFAAGAAVTVLAMLVVIRGNLSGYAHWCIKIPYVGSQFLYWRRPEGLLLTEYWDPFARVAVASCIGGVASIAMGIVPVRGLGIMLIPPMAFLSAVFQGRGYNYQLLPMTMGATLVFVVVLTNLWSRGQPEAGGARPTTHDWRGPMAAGALAFATYQALGLIQEENFRWKGDPKTWDVADRTVEPDEKKAGEYIKAHTRPDDWVFVYDSGSAATLWTSERRTAAPYYLSYWLDPIGMLPLTEVQPTPQRRAAIQAMQDENRSNACAGIQQHPPAAVAYTSQDEVYAVCAPLRDMLANDFEKATTFGPVSVQLRRGLGGGAQ